MQRFGEGVAWYKHYTCDCDTYDSEANKFQHDGYYASVLGDAMPLVANDIVHPVPMTVFYTKAHLSACIPTL